MCRQMERLLKLPSPLKSNDSEMIIIFVRINKDDEEQLPVPRTIEKIEFGM